MTPERFNQLTDQQRQCLRLVSAGYTSKEIAQRIARSPLTVDQHIKTAMARLGSTTRAEAARVFVEYEKSCAGALPQRLGIGSPALAEPPAEPPEMTPHRSEPPISGWNRFLRGGRRHNDLKSFERLRWIIIGAVIFIIAFAQLATGLDVLRNIARGLGK